MATQRDDEFPTHADADAERPVDEELAEDVETLDHVPDDVDPADYVDQHRSVPLDEDHDG